MASLRNQLRPKHQVLILKCYPKFQKNAAEVKPNSSELSYLLYYASTRRSKIQKVGAFLERKTEADVKRGKTGNVQVTLAILTALIDRTRRDLTLYAPYVLRILKTVLSSNNLGLVEDSVGTFQAFCEHQDIATFAADQALIRLYEDIVKKYASFAQKEGTGKSPMSKPLGIRWRTAGLTAIESITNSEAIGVDAGLQLAIIIPVILGNLHSESEQQVISFYSKIEDEGKSEKEPAKGRPSMATQRTNETAQMTDGTTEDADRIAEEEVGTLALRSLKQIFSSNNRGQIRLATQAMLRFVLDVVKPAAERERPGTAKTSNTTASMLVGSWPTAIFQMVARWTPVQDRFVIMVTTMEGLVKSPIAEENLESQLVLVILVDSLLSSSINMIGLSVMDVLLGLIQHILLLLQLGGRGSSILPHHQQTDAIDLFGDVDKRSSKRSSKQLTEPVAAVVEDARDEKRPSTIRQRLLDRLRICMGALANHIYYSDQISDMIAALLLRLKPSPLSTVSSPVVAVENPEAAAQAISESVKMQEDPKTDSFFSFGTARVTALNAIQNILVVANSKASVTGAGAVGRNRVPVQTWEGTQWLLRDEDKRVRRAYVDALTTWLRLEMSKNDLSVMEDRETRKSKADSKASKEPARAVSSASRRSKTPKAQRSTFLQLLHLAVYDNAIETPEDESEILLLHLLLYHLIEKLGVNSVQHGLPMIIRLQEDINQLEFINTPKAKIVIGSLVHGYFWTLVERFEFDNTLVGHEIISEIQRRKKHSLWLQAISMPPVPIDKIMVAGSANAIKYVDVETTQNEVLRPFDSLSDLVGQIATAYDKSLASPPSSPPISPSKALSSPILAATANTSRVRQLPELIRDAMLAKWTKMGCLTSIENNMTRATSMHGSQRGTLRSLKNNGYLQPENSTHRDSSPGSDGQLPSPTGRRSMRRGLAAGKAPIFRASMPPPEIRPHSPSASENQTTGGDTRSSIVRYGDLKRMLDSDAGSSMRNNSIDGALSSERKHLNRASLSIGSESMVDAEGLSDSEEEETSSPPRLTQQQTQQYQQQQQQQQQPKTIAVRPRTASQTKAVGNSSVPSTPTSATKNRTRSSSTASAEDPEANARALKGEIVPTVVRSDEEDDPDAVPPVPPLPEGLIGKVSVPRPAMGDFGSPGAIVAAATVHPSNRNGSIEEASLEEKRRSNAQKILSGIEIGIGRDSSTSADNVRGGRPPY